MEESYLTYPYPVYEERKPLINQGVFYIPEYYPVKEQYQQFDFDLGQYLNKGDLVVEFCSGTGDWIVNLARQNRDRFFIAVERKFKRVCKIASKRDAHGLNNLLIVCGNAENFVKYFIKTACVSQVYVNFPDPWPKKKHAKHRLFSPDFVNDLEKTLLKDAHIMLVTDDYPFVCHAKESLKQSGHWSYKKLASADYLDYGDSFFKTLWLSKGREIHFSRFEFDQEALAKKERAEEEQSQNATEEKPLTGVDVDLEAVDLESLKVKVEKAEHIVWHLNLLINQRPLAFSWDAWVEHLSARCEQFLKQLDEEMMEKTHGFSLFKAELSWPAVKKEAASLQSFEEVLDVKKPFFANFNHCALLLFAKIMGAFVPLFPHDKELFVLLTEIPKQLDPLMSELFACRQLFPHIHCVLPQGISSAYRYDNLKKVPVKKEVTATCALVLPDVEEITEELFEAIKKALVYLKEQKIEVRLVSECVLNEEWEGIENLAYIEKTISPMGMRMVKGFEVGGGESLLFNSKGELL